MTYKLIAAAALAAFAAAANPVAAASLSDFVGEGFVIVRSTSYTGKFEGCRRGRTLVFADGSEFVCSQTIHRRALDPRVYFLTQSGELPSALIIGGEAYRGTVIGVAGRKLVEPYIMQTDLDEESQTTAKSSSPALIEPVTAIESINTIQNAEPTVLNRAQAYPLPHNLAQEKKEAENQ